MTGKARITLWIAVIALLALARGALAEPGAPPSATATPARPLMLSASPTFGGSAPIGNAWFEVTVRLKSLVAEPLEGVIELVADAPYASDVRTVTRAPFSLAPGAVVSLNLPTHGFSGHGVNARVVARTKTGHELATFEIAAQREAFPALAVLEAPNRLAAWLRGVRLHVSGRWGSPTVFAPLGVTSPGVNPASGELVVPELAAGYAGSTVVLVTSTTLARLSARAHQALADWVLAGGCLAVALDRPEDHQSPLLWHLLGGEPMRGPAPHGLRRSRIFEVVPEGEQEEQLVERTLGPSASLAESLVGYRGGNLRPSPWGSSASYGLGEVHLLAYDPMREPGVSDPWVHRSLVELARHAWNRNIHVVFPHAASDSEYPGPAEIRRVVDPNQRTRWAIVVATILLLAYAMLAGPLNFYLAARAGRPLRALVLLPVLSLVTLAVIVGLGALAKGMHGQVRHVALIEAGAGMARAAVVRFRGFYAPSARELVVRARADGNVLEVADPGRDSERVLVIDRDGPRLEEFRAKPWQTVLVREDGFVDLKGGVTIAEVGGKVVVKNRLGRDLVGVLVRVRNGDTYHFARVTDGATVAAASGEPVGSVGSPNAVGMGLEPRSFADKLDADEPGTSAVWNAFASYSLQEADWWPADTPVLIGQIAGGAGVTSDSGLAVLQDRLMIRVVGIGGVP